MKESATATIIYIAIAVLFAAIIGALTLGMLLSFTGGPDWLIYVGAGVSAVVVIIVGMFQSWQRSWWDEERWGGQAEQ
ncbi:MAG: hypothetical protein ACLFVO_20960 [Chloroflexaceae bacterium]